MIQANTIVLIIWTSCFNSPSAFLQEHQHWQKMILSLPVFCVSGDLQICSEMWHISTVFTRTQRYQASNSRRLRSVTL